MGPLSHLSENQLDVPRSLCYYAPIDSLRIPSPMPDKPLTDSELASVVAQGGYVFEFDLESRLTTSESTTEHPRCLVTRILEFGEPLENRAHSAESRTAHEAYLGATLAQGISEALLSPRVICRTCRCIKRRSAYLVQIQSKVVDGKVQGAIMVCRPVDTDTSA